MGREKKFGWGKKFDLEKKCWSETKNLVGKHILVGNKTGDAALECQFIGPTLKFTDDRTIAITGADMSPKIDGKSVPLWESIEVKANQILELEFATIGARSYIAFAGGINSKPWLGSRSTFHKAGVGGIDGKAIENNQIIPLGKNRRIQQRKIKKVIR